MEISIEKTIEIFQGMKQGISPWYPEEYYNFAIDIMRKYQNIQQIKNDALLDIYMSGHMTGEDRDCWVRFKDVENIVNEHFREVLEDGRNLPSVTPQLSSELEKNSQKLEKDFGELDCISRIETIDYLCKHCPDDGECFKDCDEIKHLRQMPSVTPQEPKTGHCKDCKWWKDSDGEYRRGISAESQCPINRKEVYEGNGYCFLYEPQESEDKE